MSASLAMPDERVAATRRAKDEKLSAFRDEDGNPKSLSREERDQLIAEQFPSTQSLDWDGVFARDTDVFARMMRDIIKLDQREPGKSGPRPNTVDYDRGLATFRQLMGDDYSMLPFREAFEVLARGYSRRHLARKTDMSPTKAHRLLVGIDKPTDYDIRRIAEGFGKHPSYFVEHRRAFIVEQLTNALLDEPESTVAYYQRILQAQ